MSTWTDRIRSHPIWQKLETLGPAVDQALGREVVSPAASAGLNRLKAVVAFTGKRLSAADSNLVQPGPLDNLASFLERATVEVQNFVANGNDGHIVNANAHVDGALTHLAQIVVPVSSDELAGLREGADAYRAALESNLVTANSAVSTFQAELSSLQERLTALATEVSAEKQRLSSLASEHQSQFSAAQETRSKDYIEAQTSRQDKFAAQISEYAEELTEQAANFARQRDLLVQSEKDELASLTENYRDEATRLLGEIRRNKRRNKGSGLAFCLPLPYPFCHGPTPPSRISRCAVPRDFAR